MPTRDHTMQTLTYKDFLLLAESLAAQWKAIGTSLHGEHFTPALTEAERNHIRLTSAMKVLRRHYRIIP